MKTKKEELQAELTRLNALRKQVKEKLKALPVFDVGKWYKGTFNDGWLLAFFQGVNVNSYGIHHEDNLWFDNHCWFDDYNLTTINYTEAAPQEVEQALIEEAKRRGFKGGFVFDDRTNILWNQQENGEERAILSNGKWATIIEQDKFAELKEAHSNGKVIQSKIPLTDTWADNTNPSWSSGIEYRIKTEENKTLKYNDIAIIERLHDTLLDNHGYDLNSKLLSDSMELCKRIQGIIEEGAN